MSQCGLPVVITRPRAQAEPLAQRVRDLGRDAEVYPLLEIAPLADDAELRCALSHLEQFSLVAFVSPNAIEFALQYIPVWPSGVAIAVVGEGSRQALLRKGVDPQSVAIFSPRPGAPSDSESLVQALDLALVRGRKVLIVRGEHGREYLGDALRKTGAHVERVAAYRRSAPIFDAARAEQLSNLLDQGAIWLITSSEALRVLFDWTRRLDGETAVAKLQHQSMIVPHARIAQTAAELGCTSVLQTGSGDEQLLAALQSRP